MVPEPQSSSFAASSPDIPVAARYCRNARASLRRRIDMPDLLTAPPS
jgi:hypothetical protein